MLQQWSARPNCQMMEAITFSTEKRCGSQMEHKPKSMYYLQKMLTTLIMDQEAWRKHCIHCRAIFYEGFSVGKKEDKLGIRSSDTCTLVLENCKVPVENVIKGPVMVSQ